MGRITTILSHIAPDLRLSGEVAFQKNSNGCLPTIAAWDFAFKKPVRSARRLNREAIPPGCTVNLSAIHEVRALFDHCLGISAAGDEDSRAACPTHFPHQVRSEVAYPDWLIIHDLIQEPE